MISLLPMPSYVEVEVVHWQGLWRGGLWEPNSPNIWIPHVFLHIVTNFQLSRTTTWGILNWKLITRGKETWGIQKLGQLGCQWPPLLRSFKINLIQLPTTCIANVLRITYIMIYGWWIRGLGKNYHRIFQDKTIVNYTSIIPSFKQHYSKHYLPRR